MFEIFIASVSSPLFWLLTALSFFALHIFSRRKDVLYERSRSSDAEQIGPKPILSSYCLSFLFFIIQAVASGIIGSLALAGLKLVGISL